MSYFEVPFIQNQKILLSDKCNTVWGASRNGHLYDVGLISDFYRRITFKQEPINFFDIGANTGSFIFLPLLNKLIRCYAFEPAPDAYQALEENIELNNLSNLVSSFNMGLWNEPSKLDLKVPMDSTDSGLATFGNNPTRFAYDNKSGAYKTHTIECETIDRMFETLKLKTLDLIKIDTEGSELNILKGGEKTLTKFKPPILLEFDSKNTAQFGYEKENIIELLQSYGYDSFNLLAESDLYASAS